MSIERKYPLVSHVSSNVEDGSPVHCIHFKPTKRDPHKSIKGSQVQPIAQVVFDCILFGKSSFTNSYYWWNEYNFLPKVHTFRPICVPFQIATTYAPSLKYCFFSHSCQSVSVNFKCSFYTCHFLLQCIETSTIFRAIFFGIYDSVTIIAWIITRAKKFGCIEYWKAWETIIQNMNNSLHIRCIQ